MRGNLVTQRMGGARSPSCSRSPYDETVVAWDKSASRRARGWAGENVARSKEQPGPLPTLIIIYGKISFDPPILFAVN